MEIIITFFVSFFLILFVMLKLMHNQVVHRWLSNRGVLIAVTALFSMVSAVFRAYFLGFFLYIAIFYLMYDLLALLVKLFSKKCYQAMKSFGGNGLWIAILAIIISAVSMVHAKKLNIVHYTVDLNKEIANEKLRFLLATDIHLGTGNDEMIYQVIYETAQQEQVDYIIIGGDMIDESTSDDLLTIAYQKLSEIATEYPVYYVLGNHEYIRGGEVEVVEHLELAGVHVLTDEVELVDNAFYLIGRIDKYQSIASKENRATLKELSDTIDFTYPVILLDHQPVELKLAKELKVDLMLSGHTHAGQFFPPTLFAYFINEQLYGHDVSGEFHSIVSSGAGVWGMAMRNMSNSELVIIDVE